MVSLTDGSSTFVSVVVALTVVVVCLIVLLMSKKAESKTAKKAQPKVAVDPTTLTAQEVAKHNTREDCWIIVDNKVYDVTDYIDDHPGGDTIMNNAGADSTVGVHGPQHPASMWDVLQLYYIGDLQI